MADGETIVIPTSNPFKGLIENMEQWLQTNIADPRNVNADMDGTRKAPGKWIFPSYPSFDLKKDFLPEIIIELFAGEDIAPDALGRYFDDDTEAELATPTLRITVFGRNNPERFDLIDKVCVLIKQNPEGLLDKGINNIELGSTPYVEEIFEGGDGVKVFPISCFVNAELYII